MEVRVMNIKIINKKKKRKEKIKKSGFNGNARGGEGNKKRG